ncbi:hypothetical protein HRG_002824 [Hirsutella rhossiliensis]|uniref:DUF8212 domain-containing protein n=1 Tax=Hirsutella rhossiliensis TaxID=111463 RepID=A0A9P8MYN8_9HYPO|nr:uncharacterized protein HRG_02824 [Hirsutella rhossiliensis]KAH0964808.1 hypothetical protein HRG_02824 [Hirsutella rhossiliensis]
MLEGFLDGGIPRYAILMHTWGQHEETFADFRNKSSRLRRLTSKSDKIGTCCIDKSSSAELSEAINSMVKIRGPSSVRAARGFQTLPVVHEGMGLQELLAPSLLKFYDLAWYLFGYSSRTYAHGIEIIPPLTSLLAEITGIPNKLVYRESFDQASVATRMSWAAGRQTTRTEDAAYCLLGVFGVNMPMLYGEGEGAFARLQEEIMKKHDDHSLFAWELNDVLVAGLRVDGETCIAISLRHLRRCGCVTVCRPQDEPSRHFVSTNAGIHIELPLLRLRSGE